jgi:hypothetical protein
MCRTRVLSRSPAGTASTQVPSTYLFIFMAMNVTMPMPDMPVIGTGIWPSKAGWLTLTG